MKQVNDPLFVRIALILVSSLFFLVFVLFPLGLVFIEAFRQGYCQARRHQRPPGSRP